MGLMVTLKATKKQGARLHPLSRKNILGKTTGEGGREVKLIPTLSVKFIYLGFHL